MAKLGFIGLGVMGGNMVARLLEKGHTVTGYNRTRAKAQWLIDKGMKFAESPKAVAAASDVTFTMVTNAAALAAVTDGPDGLLAGIGAGKFHIDMSTVSPEGSRALAAKVREKGADMIDAPVSGSVITLQQGKLSVMVGGRKETFERLKPLLLDIGPKVTFVGDNGVALSMKIAVNLSLAVQMLAFSEGVLLAEKSGIPREVAVDVLVHSAIASPMIQYRGPFVLQQPEEAWFDVNMMQKDMVLAMDLGRQLNVPLPSTAISKEFLTAARGMGWTKYDFACMFDVRAAMSGVSTPVTQGGKKV
jgi:3-hydroxyisobutyrate dehydrogenase-like beta-hydroxyacid dehydrogenase